MTLDKWGIPYFYPSALTAGVSGSGNGFYWTQNNDIFQDSKDGMVRIGKEFDQVNVIDSSTGEFEFPYDSGADFFSIDMDMGHASGGESHGCEAAHYMGLMTINTTPPKFYFQKQYYQGGSKYQDPKTGQFTDTRVTEKVIGGGWFGFCVCKYNRKDGRSTGHDSVIIEIWFNPDPVANISNWFKVGQTEDKGGWGTGAISCDGTSDDQPFTWSAIQTRYKSGTPEFSLHPIIPEFENGSNIHAIGEANMSYSDSERRGYSKDNRIPRDIEVKCLFKFASTDGKARLKNLSMREIDPTRSFDDNPNNPPPTEEPPTNPTEIQGKFKIQWNINTLTSQSACAGTGTGGGSGSGSAIVYPVYTDNDFATDSDKELSNSSTWDNRTRLVMSPANSSSDLYGIIPKQIDIPLARSSTDPASSRLVHAKIWKESGIVIYDSPTTFDPSVLSTSYAKKTFDFSTNTHVLAVGDRIGIGYQGGDSDEYVLASYKGTSYPNTNYYQYEGTNWESKSRRLMMDIWV